MSDNWYIVLELDIEPPIHDEKVIANRIEEKKKFWAVHFNDFKNGAQYRKWHQCVPQIIKDMIGPENRRDLFVSEAIKLKYASLDTMLNGLSAKGYITYHEASKLSQKENLSIDVIEQRANFLGIEITKSDNCIKEELYNKYYATSKGEWAYYNTFKFLLSSFSVNNLYEFLSLNSSEKFTPANHPEELIKRIQTKKRNEFYKSDSISGNGTKLCGFAEIVFCENNKKCDYDLYLAHTEVKKILDEIKSVSEIAGYLFEEQVKQYSDRIQIHCEKQDNPNEIIETFTQVEEIVVLKNSGSNETKDIERKKQATLKDLNKLKSLRAYIDKVWAIADKISELESKLEVIVQTKKAVERSDKVDRSMPIFISVICLIFSIIFIIPNSGGMNSEDFFVAIFIPIAKIMLFILSCIAIVSFIVLVVNIVLLIKDNKKSKIRVYYKKIDETKKLINTQLNEFKKLDKETNDEKKQYLEMFKNTLITPLQLDCLISFIENKKASDFQEACSVYEAYIEKSDSKIQGIDGEYYVNLVRKSVTESTSNVKIVAERLVIKK